MKTRIASAVVPAFRPDHLPAAAAIILAAVLSLFVISSCGQGSDGAPDTTADTAGPGTLSIVSDGASSYTFVRGDESPLYVTDRIIDFKLAIRKSTGADLPLSSELLWGKSEGTGGIILVGETSGNRSAAKASEMRSQDWSVTVDGGDIIVCAGSSDAYAAAFEALGEYIDAEKAGFAIPADLSISHTGEYRLDMTLNGIPVGELTIVYDSLSSYAKAGAESIAETLKSATGFTLKVRSDKQSSDGPAIIVACSEGTAGGELLPGAERSWTAWSASPRGENYLIAGETPYTIDTAVKTFVKKIAAMPAGSCELEKITLSGTVENSASAGPKDSRAVRVMTSNILWTNSDRKTYAERAEIIAGIIGLYRPDVITFNEYYGTMATLLSDLLSGDYDIVFPEYEDIWNGDFSGYTNSLEKLEQHICATPIAVRKDSGLVTVASGFRYTSEKWWIHSISWIVLKDGSGRTFGVCGNHYGSPDVGNFSVDTLACVDDVRKTYGNIPFIITGDLYFWSGDEGYRTITSAGYQDTFNSAGRVFGGGSYHQVGDIVTGTSTPIDHIFCSQNCTALKHHLISDNISKWCSDHFPVYADIRIG
ncbi:MAG: hypothetical protein J5919_07490 [Clostridia bacterium]|nr:hypothetical protein [Clostridia bacterium]